MLVADFTKKDEEVTVDGLWMYDFGQKIQINGITLPDVFEVHFFWKGLDKAKVVTGYSNDGVSVVDIPNEGLTQKHAITAYIYLSSPEEGETTNTIMMFVNKRVAPEGFETPDDVDLFHYTLLAAAEYLKQTKEAKKVSVDKSVESESWAHGHMNYPERSNDNAKYYADQAKQVATQNGFCRMEIREDGHLYLSRTENIVQSLDFKINDKGRLGVMMS